MSQEQWIILLLKIFCISGFLSLTGWATVYTAMAPWYRNAIGRTLVVKTLLIAALLIPTTLSLFFSFNRLTSTVAGWIDVALIGLITPVMCWRIAVWRKIHQDAESASAITATRVAELEAENARLLARLAEPGETE